jgi:hypothetical protein
VEVFQFITYGIMVGPGRSGSSFPIQGDLGDIETAASQIKVHGTRYSDAAQRMINC